MSDIIYPEKPKKDPCKGCYKKFDEKDLNCGNCDDYMYKMRFEGILEENNEQ